MYPNPDPNPMQTMNFPQGQMVNSGNSSSPFQKVPTQQQVPNPYDQGQMQNFAKGGKVAGKKMHYAHMSKEEAETLDKLQGKTTRHRKSKTRAYPGLEAILKNPHLYKLIKQHAKEHKAEGGVIGYAEGGSVEGLKKNGRFGDTEIVMIGPRTMRLFDELAGHKGRNPKDGHPEYFSLGKMFGSIGKTLGRIPKTIVGGVKKVGKKAKNLVGGISPELGALAGGALGSVVPGVGTAVGSALGGAAPGMVNNMMGEKKPNNPYANLANQAQGYINKGQQMYGQGQAYGQNLYNQGQNYGHGLMNQGQQMANQYQQQARDMYGQGQQNVNQMYGQGQQAANNMMGQYNQGRQQFNNSLNAMSQNYQQPYQYNPYYS